MRLPICLGLLLATLSSATAQYMSYADWERLSRPSRGIYTAGLFDAFLQSSVMYGQGVAAKHYMTCIQKAGMPNGQLADNLYGFIQKHPQSRRASLQDSMLSYLNEFCGEPPQK